MKGSLELQIAAESEMSRTVPKRSCEWRKDVLANLVESALSAFHRPIHLFPFEMLKRSPTRFVTSSGLSVTRARGLECSHQEHVIGLIEVLILKIPEQEFVRHLQFLTVS